MTLSRLKQLILIAIPPGLMALWIWRFGVNVPFWDQWNTPGDQLVQYVQGSLTLESFWAQHNESRKVFPKLLFMGLANLFGWHPKLEMGLTWLLACGLSWGIYCLSTLTLKLSTAHRLLILAAVNWIIFNPAQWENWLWGIQIITVIPATALVISLLALASSLNPLAVFTICGLAATVATFSFSNGLTLWLASLPALVAYAVIKRQRWLPLGWLLWMGAVVVSYFAHYEKPAGHPSMTEALVHPLKAAAFFFAYLGSPFAFGDLYVAIGVGLMLVLGFTFTAGYTLRATVAHHNLDLLQRHLPWICLGGYSILSAFLAAAGRVGFGVGAAMSSRYVTFASLLSVAMVYSLILVAPMALSQRWSRQTLRRAGLFLAALFTVSYAATYAYGLRGMEATYRNRIFARSCLMLISLVQDAGCVEQHNALFPARTIVQEHSKTLNQAGLLRPPLADATILANFKTTEPLTQHGAVETLTTDAEGKLSLSGWAILPERTRPADAVVLTYEAEPGVTTILQVIQVSERRPDVAAKLGRPYRLSGWSTLVEATLVPADLSSLKAWAFDSRSHSAYEI